MASQKCTQCYTGFLQQFQWCKVIGAVFKDFRKAFDFADHNILGYKLQARSITVSLEIGITR